MPAPVQITKLAPLRKPIAPRKPLVKLGVTPKLVINGIPVWSLYDEVMPIEDLKGREHPHNDNDHDDTQTLFLANIFRNHGIRRSITLSRLTGRIVAGHGALKAAPIAGMEGFPVQWQDFESESQELAHLMADNEIARQSMRNEGRTAANLDLLSQDGYDLSLTGILEGDRTDLLSLLSPSVPDANPTKKEKVKVESFEDLSDQLPGAMALKTDMIFPSNAMYDLPEYRLDMCMGIPKPFDSWAGRDASPPQDGVHYLYNFSSSARELPMERSIFSFYEEDKRFDSLWINPDKWAARIISGGFMGSITPDYSIWSVAPMATRIWQLYKERWVGRYFQEAGIKIIPGISATDVKSLEYSLSGIPVGLPALSMQYQAGIKTPEEVGYARSILSEVEARLKPKQVLVYGGDKADIYLKGVFKHAEVIYVVNRMQKRRAVIGKK